MTDFTIIEAPSNLGLKPDSVEHLAGALLDAGLARRLDARRHARLAVPPYDARRDPDTEILNAARIRDFSIMLADIVGPVVARGSFPVVLGGDCSILLGNLLALRRTRQRHGLLFLDGHADFYQPEASTTGEAARHGPGARHRTRPRHPHRHRRPAPAGARRGRGGAGSARRRAGARVRQPAAAADDLCAGPAGGAPRRRR